MDFLRLVWSLGAARSVSALPSNLLSEALGLAFLWMVVIVCVIVWLRSPAAPSLDDQEPRGTGRR